MTWQWLISIDILLKLICFMCFLSKISALVYFLLNIIDSSRFLLTFIDFQCFLKIFDLMYCFVWKITISIDSWLNINEFIWFVIENHWCSLFFIEFRWSLLKIIDSNGHVIENLWFWIVLYGKSKTFEYFFIEHN